MTDDNTNVAAGQQPPTSNPALKSLEVLVGTWDMKGHESGPDGEIHGQVSFFWLEGGFFLVQHIDLDFSGRKVKGIEIIGYERKWGADAPSQNCTSHVFDNMGNHLEYVWEVDDTTLTIWGGYKGSAASFKGTISSDKNTITGCWQWPGGGYESTITRVKSK